MNKPMQHHIQTSRSEYRLDISDTNPPFECYSIRVYERGRRLWLFPCWKAVYEHPISEKGYLACLMDGWYGPCMDAVLDYEYQLRTLALEKV
jgi:hypothetical protein